VKKFPEMKLNRRSSDKHGERIKKNGRKCPKKCPFAMSVTNVTLTVGSLLDVAMNQVV
jgi:hypothetical protein